MRRPQLQLQLGLVVERPHRGLLMERSQLRLQEKTIIHVVDEAEEYSAKEFKKLLPAVKGVACTIDTKWHNRVIVAYPAVREPFSKSTPFSKKHSVRPRQQRRTACAASIQPLRCVGLGGPHRTTGEEAPF